MKRKSNNLVIEITAAIFTLSVLAWVFVPRFLESQNINTPQNFPDPVVRAAVEKFMGVEPGGYFNQRMASEKTETLSLTPDVGTIKLGDEHHQFMSNNNEPILGISSLQGLHYFQNILGVRFVASPAFAEINLSDLTDIRNISIKGGNIKNVSFTVCDKIAHINLLYGQLETIDISKNSKLVNLNVVGNSLKKLNVSNNILIESLSCSRNNISEIKFTELYNLKILRCHLNELTEIDLSQNTKLWEVDIGCNPIKSIDLSNQPDLKFLYVDDHQLLHSEIILHPSAQPEIRLREQRGGNTPLAYYPIEKQQRLQARINELLGIMPTPSPTNNHN